MDLFMKFIHGKFQGMDSQKKKKEERKDKRLKK